MRITKHELYSENDTLVDALLKDMIKLPIKHVGKFVIINQVIEAKNFIDTNFLTNKI